MEAHVSAQQKRERPHHGCSLNPRQGAIRTAHGRRPHNRGDRPALLLIIEPGWLKLAVLREAGLTFARRPVVSSAAYRPWFFLLRFSNRSTPIVGNLILARRGGRCNIRPPTPASPAFGCCGRREPEPVKMKGGGPVGPGLTWPECQTSPLQHNRRRICVPAQAPTGLGTAWPALLQKLELPPCHRAQSDLTPLACGLPGFKGAFASLIPLGATTS